VGYVDRGPPAAGETVAGPPTTVEEAEEILSRLADRGHLVVESQDGALFYALPGRRSGWIPVLPCQPAPVHGEGNTVHVGSGVRSQVDDRALEVLWLAEAAGR
jgi:hypothetical protein